MVGCTAIINGITAVLEYFNLMLTPRHRIGINSGPGDQGPGTRGPRHPALFESLYTL